VLEHETCDEQIIAAQHSGKYGWAEYLAARCEQSHRDIPDHETTATREHA